MKRTFTFEAGAAIRGQMRRALEKGAWDYGLHVHVQESKGWLESAFQFTVEGQPDAVESYLRDVQDYSKRLQLGEER